MPDGWRRFGEIWAMVMDDCCLPMICEATICRAPMWACALTKRTRWEKMALAWDAGERPNPRWAGDTIFQVNDSAPESVAKDEA